jgi:anti-sigma regulatory factor (Ser/Thr protein kinase)
LTTRAIRLPRDRSCAALARRFLEQQLAAELSPRALNDAKLVASELVDNAYLHGRGLIELVLDRRQDRVRVEVIDQGQGAAVKIRRRAARDLGGHGLRLVQQLSCAWGAHQGTTHVWAELPVR